MPFDVMDFVDRVEKKSPGLSRHLGVTYLNWFSPFNKHLKAKLLEWNNTKTRFRIQCHRGVRNHLGGIHAGAIFTLGETCAGFVLIKNFSLKKFRPIMSDVNVKYEKQARGTTFGTAEIKKAEVARINKELKSSKPSFVWLKTKIENDKNELIATVNTKWQLKPWDKIKIKK